MAKKIINKEEKTVKKQIFELSVQQKEDILNSVKLYINSLKNKDIREKYELQMKDADFRKKLILGFAEISFLSTTLILDVKSFINFNTVYKVTLEASKNDIFEIQELKLYMINVLIDERTPKHIINKDFNEAQLKEYRRKLSEFKKEYISLFD